MSRKKISTTIYVTPEQNDRLKLLHERTKVPVAVYIREGIDLVLRQYAHLLPGQLPLDAAPLPVSGMQAAGTQVGSGAATVATPVAPPAKVSEPESKDSATPKVAVGAARSG
ncbi:MAG: ribbon-helix-helix domain-containing protein [Polyangiaceae bacterium]